MRLPNLTRKGYIPTLEHRQKIASALKGKPKKSWLTGLTTEQRRKQWQEYVKDHDGILYQRIEQLHKDGAVILYTNFKTVPGAPIPDVIYLKGNQLIYEDVKRNGRVQREYSTNLQSIQTKC